MAWKYMSVEEYAARPIPPPEPIWTRAFTLSAIFCVLIAAFGIYQVVAHYDFSSKEPRRVPYSAPLLPTNEPQYDFSDLNKKLEERSKAERERALDWQRNQQMKNTYPKIPDNPEFDYYP